MGVTVCWDDEAKTIIRFDIEGMWSFAELEEGIFANNALLTNINYHVHTIVHFKPGARVPRADSSLMDYCKGLMSACRQKEGLILVVSKDDLIASLIAVFKTLFPKLGKPIMTVRSLDVARRVLHQHIMSEMAAHQPRHLTQTSLQ